MADLTVRDLVVEYVSDGYSVRAVDGLNFQASKGELLVLLGPSGSGKTSLLSCLAGILKPSSGSVTLGETVVTSLGQTELVSYRRQQVGIVFQAFNLIPSVTARENVAAPLLVAGRSRRESLARADELLRLVHLEDRARHRPGKLSGGQQQRVALARALALDPPMLLADEPTANLDYINAESIVALLRDLRSKGRLIIVSTHDQRLIPIADSVVRMVSDTRADTGPPRHVTYAAGETIFEQGSRGELVYVIHEGEAEIIRVRVDGREEAVAVLAPGNYFGELGPLLGFPRSATARARTKLDVIAYGVQDFREQILGQVAPGVPEEEGTGTLDTAAAGPKRTVKRRAAGPRATRTPRAPARRQPKRSKSAKRS